MKKHSVKNVKTKGSVAAKLKNNKGRLIGLALVIVLFATLLVSAILFLHHDKNLKLASALENCYDLVLNFDDNMSSATLTEEFIYTNTCGEKLNSLVFRLYPNAFSNLGSKSGGIEVLSAKIDRQSVDCAISKEDSTVLTLPCNLEALDTCTVSLDCKITIPTSDKRFGKTAYSVNMTAFYPVISTYQNSAWRTDAYSNIGDPFMSGIASFYVTATLPQNYKIATCGKITETSVKDNHQTVEIVAENIRDYALIVSDKFNVASSTATLKDKTVDVNYFYLDDKNSLGTVNLAVDALTTFSGAFGNYPYKNFTVVQAPLTAGGMEYGSLVQIAPMSNRKNADDTLVHETAHQWWYGVVGSDQFNSAWLDEGLTEFCTGYYYRLRGNNARFTAYIDNLNKGLNSYATVLSNAENISMERHLSSFANES
ncbi:MAG: M1 family metallopeptidase, partial [Clostridia bacterium]